MNDTQKLAEIYKQMRLDEAKKKMDPVGDADADIDNDGDVDDSDEYLHNRRKAIKKGMKEEKVECPKCKGDGCDHCDDEGYHEESVEIDTDDGEVTKAKVDKKKKKKDAESEVQDVEEGVELAEGKKLRNVLTDREFEKSMKKALADKGNYKGGKVNWNFIDADVYMELSAKGYDLRHPSINYMKRFDALADKLDPEMNESVDLDEGMKQLKVYVVMDKKTGKAVTKPMGFDSAVDAYDSRGGNAKGLALVKITDKRLKESVEVEEAALTVGIKQPVKVDDTEEKGHMDAVKANKAGPTAKQPKKIKELRK